jgi:hypothetical protein
MFVKSRTINLRYHQVLTQEPQRGTEQVYYVCATNIAGGRVGFNIEYQSDRCYTDSRQAEIYGESDYCLCSNKPVSPIE